MRSVIVALIAVGLLGSATHAVPTAVTFAVPGRANANVSMAAADRFVAVAWSASTDAGVTDIFAATSTDGGATFSAAVRVNTTAGDARVNGEQPPRVALRERQGLPPEIAVVWTTKNGSGSKLLQGISVDGGRTFRASTLVPGTDAPGNRGWEGLGVGPGGRFFAVWLDHRRLAQPQETAVASEHQHHAGMPMAAAANTKADGVATAQLSQLYVSSLDGGVAPVAVTGGVCYCCKTAIVAGSGDSLFVAWRHVYPGNMRDIAFAASRDGGRTFTPPVRVSEDKWQIEGCPDDGPTMAVDPQGRIHIVWPAVVTEAGGPVKALFQAMSLDGKVFSARKRLPAQGQANHPQLAINRAGDLRIVWDESGTGTRRLASARGVLDQSGAVRFVRDAAPGEIGTYPVVAWSGSTWLRAWTSGDPARSVINVKPLGS